MIYNLIHEIPVVTDYYNTSREILKIFLQNLQRLNVQIISRLIQNEEIRITHQYSTQIELSLFSSTQLIYIIMLFLRCEEEELEKLRSSHVFTATEINIIGNFCNYINNLLVFTELQPFLREITKAYSLTDIKFTLIRIHFTQEHLDKRRFTGTIITHNTHFLKTGKVIIKMIKYHLFMTMIFKSLANILAFKNLATNINSRSLQSYLPVLNALFGHFFKFIESLFTIACFMSTSLWLSAHPVKFSSIQILRMLNLSTKIVHSFLTFLQIICIITSIGINGLVVQFKDNITNLIKEETIVSNHENSLVSPIQITLQPFYHFQIQMVSRLIQHQKIGFFYQYISKCHTFLLATTELPHRLLKISDMQLRKYLFSFQYLFRISIMIEASIQYSLLWIKVW